MCNQSAAVVPGKFWSLLDVQSFSMLTFMQVFNLKVSCLEKKKAKWPILFSGSVTEKHDEKNCVVQDTEVKGTTAYEKQEEILNTQ